MSKLSMKEHGGSQLKWLTFDLSGFDMFNPKSVLHFSQDLT